MNLRVFFVSLITFVIGASPVFALPKKVCLKTVSEAAKESGLTEKEMDRFLWDLALLAKKKKAVPHEYDIRDAFKGDEEITTKLLKGRNISRKQIFEWVGMARMAHPERFADLEIAIARKVASFVRDNWIWPTVAEVAQLFHMELKEFTVMFGSDFSLEELIETHQPKLLESLSGKLMGAYTRVVRKTDRNPTMEELALELGIPVASLKLWIGEDRPLFKDLAELKESAMEASPQSFDYFRDTDVFTEQKRAALISAVKNSKSIIITTAVAKVKVEDAAYEALQALAREKKAPIIVIPIDMKTNGLDERLLTDPNVHILLEPMDLTPYLQISDIQPIAKIKNPLQGIADLVRTTNSSWIVASPKMHGETIAVDQAQNAFMPLYSQTTGAITKPEYGGGKVIQRRTSKMAALQHWIGAVLLERADPDRRILDLQTAGTYHVRELEFIPEKGGFLDKNVFYTKDGAQTVRPEALVLGDVHVGVTDPSVAESLRGLINDLKPKVVVLHDLFDGLSINHHLEQDMLTLSKLAETGKLDLRTELAKCVAFINSLLALSPDMTVVVVRANHNQWLHKYLQTQAYAEQPNNAYIGAVLFKAYKEGQDPLKYALMTGGQPVINHDPNARNVHRFETLLPGGGIDFSSRVVFMDPGKSYKKGVPQRWVELASHGDKGANGRRGGMRDYVNGLGRAIFGHSHTDARKNGVVNVGTITLIPQDYNKEGLGNWVHSVATVGPNGEIQRLRFINGEWYAQASDSKQNPSEEFFFPGYPRLRKPDVDTSVDATDQWSGQ